MAKASIQVHSSVNQQELAFEADAVSLVLESIAAAGLSDKAACIEMRFDPSQFSKVKQGQARLPLDAVWRLPDAFWSDFAERVKRARGICEASQRSQRAERIGELIRLLLSEVA